ncbi:MAG: hypothetical protein KGL39_55245 [Patescibacteria group bacterium]|nr:hypothetical protein [Patescibacteria group bacterium]
MANSDLNRIMDTARINLPGALDANIQNELFYTLNEFFQDSNIWYEDVDFPVVPATGSYATNPSGFTYTINPTSGSITRLIGVGNVQGGMVTASMPVTGSIVLLNSPPSASTYTARVALTVDDPVTKDGYPVCPEWVLNKYNNNITDGVIARMMMQKAKPYTDLKLAAVRYKSFRAGVSQARVEAQHQNVYRRQSWRFPQAFSTRHYGRN